MSILTNNEEGDDGWRCTCGILNPNKERFCDCGKRKDEETVEVSIPKNPKIKEWFRIKEVDNVYLPLARMRIFVPKRTRDFQLLSK